MSATDPFYAAAQADLTRKETTRNAAELDMQRKDTTYKSTAGYVSQERRKTIEEDKKRDGNNAATEARKKYAGYIANDVVGKNDPTLANRILKGDEPKDKTMEKILEKLNENK